MLTPAQDRTVTVLAELIILETDTPGAKAALVNRYIDEVLADAPAAEREGFLKLRDALGTIDEMWRGGFEGCAHPEHGAPAASAQRE